MSENITIITNNVPRDIIGWMELTFAEREEFNYVEPVEYSEFQAFRYKGSVYDLNEFLYTGKDFPADHPLRAWDGYRGDSFFSGLVVRYVENYERVIVGRYYS